MSRFNYIKFDKDSMKLLEGVRKTCENLEAAINALGTGRSQSLALTSLEEFYMWVGKSLRDAQIARTGVGEEFPERV